MSTFRLTKLSWYQNSDAIKEQQTFSVSSDKIVIFLPPTVQKKDSGVPSKNLLWVPPLRSLIMKHYTNNHTLGVNRNTKTVKR